MALTDSEKAERYASICGHLKNAAIEAQDFVDDSGEAEADEKSDEIRQIGRIATQSKEWVGDLELKAERARRKA